MDFEKNFVSLFFQMHLFVQQRFVFYHSCPRVAFTSEILCFVPRLCFIPFSTAFWRKELVKFLSFGLGLPHRPRKVCKATNFCCTCYPRTGMVEDKIFVTRASAFGKETKLVFKFKCFLCFKLLKSAICNVSSIILENQ